MSFLDKFKGILGKESLDVFARYELLREAVSGTMSNFYMARDRETDKIVGLKIADKEKLDAFESRFKGLKKPCEGEIAIQLKHPHVVETFEHGITKNGLRFLVMEFVEGHGLHAMINDEDSIFVGKRLNLLREMADAIDYVHREGFIHRDICPRNFICELDGSSVKLIDFGLTLPATEPFMRPGNRTGTPAYMSPEISRRRKTDQRVDIFSFGMTAYQLCTFALPWPVSDKPAMSALAYGTTVPDDILAHAPQLNKTLAQAIMLCLSSEPADRPQTGNDFLRLIQDVKSDNEE